MLLFEILMAHTFDLVELSQVRSVNGLIPEDTVNGKVL